MRNATVPIDTILLKLISEPTSFEMARAATKTFPLSGMAKTIICSESFASNTTNFAQPDPIETYTLVSKIKNL